MITVNTHEAKTKLSALLAAVETRAEVVRICRNGREIAELRAIRDTAPDPFVMHPELQPVFVSSAYDPTAPLDEDAWPEEAR